MAIGPRARKKKKHAFSHFEQAPFVGGIHYAFEHVCMLPCFDIFSCPLLGQKVLLHVVNDGELTGGDEFGLKPPSAQLWEHNFAIPTASVIRLRRNIRDPSPAAPVVLTFDRGPSAS